MKNSMSYKEAYTISTDFLNKAWFSSPDSVSPFEVHSYSIVGERYNGSLVYGFLVIKLNRDINNPDCGDIVIITQDSVHQEWVYDGFILQFVNTPDKSALAKHIMRICSRYNFTLVEKL